MKKWFPDMMDRPSPGVVFCIFVYWVFAFLLLPFALPVIGAGLWHKTALTAWLDLIYYVINAAFLVLICKEYLKDSFFNVQMETANFFKTAGIAIALMLLFVPASSPWLSFPEMHFSNHFPVTELAVAVTPGTLAIELPIVGTMVLTLLVPFSVSILFYASTFAPIAVDRPWLGYLMVCVITGLLCLFDIFWRDQASYNLLRYLFQLPIHLIACWSYQKTDTVWTPILALAGFNLISSLYAIIVFSFL